MVSSRVVGTEERIPIPLMDYILNVVRKIETICHISYLFLLTLCRDSCAFLLDEIC